MSGKILERKPFLDTYYRDCLNTLQVRLQPMLGGECELQEFRTRRTALSELGAEAIKLLKTTLVGLINPSRRRTRFRTEPESESSNSGL